MEKRFFMHKINYTRHLPLTNAPNTRDLGGYTCHNGTTHWGTFLRSSSISSLSNDDIDILSTYGVTDLIDLRSAAEQDAQPYSETLMRQFTCHKVSMLDEMNSSGFQGSIPSSMGELYITLLKTNGKDFANIFSIFAQAKGCSLFHCTAGKDRTGVTAMLLLNLLGVSDLDIIADYSVTEIYMHDVFALQLKTIEGKVKKDIPDYLFESKVESMQKALSYLKENFGSAEQYLLQNGAILEDLQTVQNKFTQLTRS